MGRDGAGTPLPMLPTVWGSLRAQRTLLSDDPASFADHWVRFRLAALSTDPAISYAILSRGRPPFRQRGAVYHGR